MDRFPRILLLPTHLAPDERQRLEDMIPSLTRDAGEARVVVGNISKRERAQFELRRLRLETEECGDEPGAQSGDEDVVAVVGVAWLRDSLQAGAALPVDDYLIYKGRRVMRETARDHQTAGASHVAHANPHAKALARRRQQRRAKEQQPHLIHETTSEDEGGDEDGHGLPPVPDFMHTPYSCQRRSPMNPPNAAFMEELKAIRTLRVLKGDQVGVRAYSTSIAALAAYPHRIESAKEVSRLPGCGNKIAILFQQWTATGRTAERAEASSDERLAVLSRFYDIWGVGETTARELYNKGRREIDDIVEHGWTGLTRVQQIGIKHYDDFQVKIPRAEVEAIGGEVLRQARRVVDAGVEMMIVGGYRRGSEESSDVDVLLSHRDAGRTLGAIEGIVAALEEEGFITHTLSLTTHNSERGQEPLPWRGSAGGGRAGSGFDTLDKALVVWQDPGGQVRRRVDMIVSPWRTVGCAVVGWSGATTFERDLRRYCKKEKGLKFDSSGIRRRADGAWVDLEADGDGPAPDMQTAERRVFAGLGLEWLPPWERCTG